MCKVFVISLIFLLGFLEGFSQYGRYTIDRVDKKDAEGFVTIDPYHITILQDSLAVRFPISDILEEDDRTYFFLEGCYNNIAFQGAATLFSSEYKKGGIYNCVLYIEIRTRRGYSFTRFGLYFYQQE